MGHDLFKQEVIEGSIFEHDASVGLQKLIFERYQKLATISIMDSILYADFAKMVYETHTHLLPYLRYEIRPEIRQKKWMVLDKDGKLLRTKTPEEMAQVIIDSYIETSLKKHTNRLEVIRTQKETNNRATSLVFYDVITEQQ